MLRIRLVTVGDPARLTGGHLYQRQLVRHAPEHGAHIDIHPIPVADRDAQHRAARAIVSAARRTDDALLVDGLAASLVVDADMPLVALVHQRPGGDGRSATRRARELRTYRTADAVVATGPGPAADLGAAGLTPTLVVPGTDRPAPEVVPAAGLRAGREAAVLCVANWLPGKGITDLLGAVERLEQRLVTLHLAGDPTADTAYADEVLRLVRSESLAGRVVVHGVVPPGRVASLLAGSDVFALPSREEAYGMAWAEAMAVGRPVVGWRTSNLPNLVSHGVEGLLAPPGDLDALAEAVGSFATDAATREAMGAAARERASAFPTWSETTRRLVEIVRAAVRQPAPA